LTSRFTAEAQKESELATLRTQMDSLLRAKDDSIRQIVQEALREAHQHWLLAKQADEERISNSLQQVIAKLKEDPTKYNRPSDDNLGTPCFLFFFLS